MTTPNHDRCAEIADAFCGCLAKQKARRDSTRGRVGLAGAFWRVAGRGHIADLAWSGKTCARLCRSRA